MSILKSLGIEEYTNKFKEWIEKKLEDKQDKTGHAKLIEILGGILGKDFNSDFSSDFAKGVDYNNN